MSALIDATALETAKYVNKMTVTVFVTNTGSEFVKLLKAGSVLDSDLPTRSFVLREQGRLEGGLLGRQDLTRDGQAHGGQRRGDPARFELT